MLYYDTLIDDMSYSCLKLSISTAIFNSVGIYKFFEFSLGLYFGISATINSKTQSSYSMIMFNITMKFNWNMWDSTFENFHFCAICSSLMHSPYLVFDIWCIQIYMKYFTVANIWNCHLQIWKNLILNDMWYTQG